MGCCCEAVLCGVENAVSENGLELLATGAATLAIGAGGGAIELNGLAGACTAAMGTPKGLAPGDTTPEGAA